MELQRNLILYHRLRLSPPSTSQGAPVYTIGRPPFVYACCTIFIITGAILAQGNKGPACPRDPLSSSGRMSSDDRILISHTDSNLVVHVVTSGGQPKASKRRQIGELHGRAKSAPPGEGRKICIMDHEEFMYYMGKKGKTISEAEAAWEKLLNDDSVRKDIIKQIPKEEAPIAVEQPPEAGESPLL